MKKAKISFFAVVVLSALAFVMFVSVPQLAVQFGISTYVAKKLLILL
jgi:hypothetical protein